MLVTVAIPVLDGAGSLERVLTLAAAQRVEAEIELLVCDSGSRDGSPQLARRLGATVLSIEREQFGHGRTRNLLMEHASGSHVAFLTQDSVPEDTAWLGRLLAGFELADDVGLVFGPYRPAADASPMVERELMEWFRSLSPDGAPRVDRLTGSERSQPPSVLRGSRAYFTDANGCIAHAAWREVQFRDIAYAEDHALALDMLQAGYAKAYMPDARVIHSHEYSLGGWLRRSFDESRAIREVYGWVEPAGAGRTAMQIWGRVGADWRWGRHHGISGPWATPAVLVRALGHHAVRMLGAILGARSERLPAAVVEWLSSEGRR